MPKSCLDCPMVNNEDWCVLQKIPINDNDVPSTWEELKRGCPLEERPKGHWIWYEVRGQMLPYCSECGNGLDVIYEYDFCPDCGADMRGESE